MLAGLESRAEGEIEEVLVPALRPETERAHVPLEPRIESVALIVRYPRPHVGVHAAEHQQRQFILRERLCARVGVGDDSLRVGWRQGESLLIGAVCGSSVGGWRAGLERDLLVRLRVGLHV